MQNALDACRREFYGLSETDSAPGDTPEDDNVA
jgi:hypothetical protein